MISRMIVNYAFGDRTELSVRTASADPACDHRKLSPIAARENSLLLAR